MSKMSNYNEETMVHNEQGNELNDQNKPLTSKIADWTKHAVENIVETGSAVIESVKEKGTAVIDAVKGNGGADTDPEAVTDDDEVEENQHEDMDEDKDDIEERDENGELIKKDDEELDPQVIKLHKRMDASAWKQSRKRERDITKNAMRGERHMVHKRQLNRDQQPFKLPQRHGMN